MWSEGGTSRLPARRGRVGIAALIAVVLLACILAQGAYAKKAESKTTEQLIEDLGSPFLKARVYAADELGNRADEKIAGQAVPGLINILDDRTPLMWASSHSGDSETSEMRSATGRPTTSPAKEAAETLGKLGDHRATKPLINLLRVGAPYEREAAIEALAQIEGENSFDVLAAVFRHHQLDETSEVARDAMCEVMSEACTERPMDLTAARRVMTLLRDESPAVRIMGVRVLGDMHEPLAVPMLSELAQRSGNSDVREAASEALKQIKEFQTPPTPWKALALGSVLLLLGLGSGGYTIYACKKERAGNTAEELGGCGVILGLVLIVMVGLGCVGVSHFVSAVSLNKASSEGNLAALVKKAYSGRAPYPGNRGAAIALMQLADGGVIKVLGKDALGEDTRKKTISRWMLARIVTLRKGAELERLAGSDPEVRTTLAWVRKEMRDPPVSAVTKRTDPLGEH